MTEDPVDDLLRQLTDKGGANGVPQLMDRIARLLAPIKKIYQVF